MSLKNAPHEQYIEQVKAEEKKKKRRYLLLLLLFLLIGIIGGGGLFSLMRSPEGLEYRTFNKTDLDVSKVMGILADKNVRLLVADYDRGRFDTIRTVEEYKQLYGDGMDDFLTEDPDTSGYNPGFENEEFAYRDNEAEDENKNRQAFNQYERRNTGSGEDWTSNNGPLKKFKLDIIGKKVAGEIMSFIITDYNPAIKYSLDFGNGVTQDVKEITLYPYPSSGRFTLNLTATDPQFNRSITTAYLEIKENNQVSLVDNNSGSTGDEGKVPLSSEWEFVNGNPDNGENTENPDNSMNTDQGNENPDTDGADDGKITEINRNSSTDIEQPRSTTPTEQVNTQTDEDFDAANIKAPLTAAEIYPSFPGGTQSMYSFLNQHIAYPQQARDFEVEGKVYVQFEVDRGGTIKHPKVVKGLGYGCDEEALRIVELMPKWEPARHRNQEVPFLYTLPVTFKLID